uniref:Uncharacterized protein n=1 Tax=Anopheles funestus TaxID=62324 RepID=A0A182S1W9_ANOFN
MTAEPGTSKASDSRTSAETMKSIPVQKTSDERSQTKDAKEKQMLENVYARELFFRHTNITQVLAQTLPTHNETLRQTFAAKLYRNYLLVPKQRIRKYLDEVRFDTRYNEGLFRMAIKVPITSAQELTAHRQKLANAGIRKLCFVDMTVNNLVLEHQEKIVETLKTRFNNWSGKLEKLSTYITMYQRQREADDREFLSQLKHHSSMKGKWTLQLPEVVEELVQESRISSEKRKNLFWSTLRFDDDALNKKYETGDYSKTQKEVDINPDVLSEYCPRRTVKITQEKTRVDARENQLVDNTGTVQTSEVFLVIEKLSVHQRTTMLQDQPHRTATNQPKQKSQPKRIPYESETFSDEIITIASDSFETESDTPMITDQDEEVYFSCTEGTMSTDDMQDDKK